MCQHREPPLERMCLVRMRQRGHEGKYMCRYIVHSMWEDVEQRSKIMGIDAIHRKESMRAMTETFYAAIFGYDEGILSGDGVLAAALWRNMFKRQCEDPRQLELMLEYVRKQVREEDNTPYHQIKKNVSGHKVFSVHLKRVSPDLSCEERPEGHFSILL
uniref:Ubiquinol-cytochrome c chaperone domain-containing protein n=1 Tax=Oncorhynchus tshawytscha TaxID=74940 RepID=A0A8C8GS99_ONCTS